jgi:hypothetical protein
VIAGGPVTVNPPVNPNAPVVTYDFNGYRRESSPGKIKLTAGRAAVFQRMQSMYDAGDWGQLGQVCETEIQAVPAWLTPYLYAGVAYARLGDREKAIKRLEYVEREAAGNEDYSDAARILKLLGSQQKPSASESR